ncbi:MAG TPA: ABC transporter permease subunit [Candidatus Binataceae bacterium]|nr:ABC transporter permease subunit [Candidatus Binataceae bacterium]
MRRRTFTLRKAINWLLSFLVLAGVLALFFQYHHRVTGLRPRLSVQISNLPYYAFCSFYRMLAAYVLSLIFAIPYGLSAARSPRHERYMIPAIDIAQSVPVVGFFPAAIYFFVALSGGRLGVELAAIFLIFTSQAWNLALGVFEAVKTIPADSIEALDSFGVSGWLRLKRLYLPASVPKLVYNSILSWVAGWYFLIACEIIAVGPARYKLPGLGSYLMESSDKGRTGELIAGLATLLAIILVMDVLVWQPLSIWAQKFRYEFAASESVGANDIFDMIVSLGVNISRFTRALIRPLAALGRRLAQAVPRRPALGAMLARCAKPLRVVWLTALTALMAYALIDGLIALVRTLSQPWPAEARLIPAAAGASLIRLLIAYAISLAWTLPITLFASDNPRFDRLLAPLAEIAGSMPATALFPVIVLFVIRLTGNMNLASVLLILTGMQWYLLFNLLAGARQVPADLKEAARSFGLGRYASWRKVAVPALTPSLVTGSITAWGGGWNALILSEYFIYRGHHYEVLGLGALLDRATYESGNGTMILLSLLSMVLIVMGINRLVWRPVYNYVTERYRVDY